MHPVLHAFLSQTAPEAAPAQGPSSLLGSPLVMIAAMFAIFYFVVLRPQTKERRRLQAWVSAMKKGDEVVTQSGIVGVVVAVEDRTVTLDVGGGTKLRMLKTAVAGPWNQSEPQPAKAEARK
jgi:preprotein translocase subunit YajC